MTNKELMENMFFNADYLEEHCKKLISIDSTNTWGFDGVKSTKYIFPNGSSYEDYFEDNYSNDKNNVHEYRYVIDNEPVTKQEFLDFNNISREISCKGWFHSYYDGDIALQRDLYVKGSI